MNYLYQNGAERYQFYRIPKVLFTNPRFSSLSSDAKILYGLMLDRSSLSMQNGWLDESQRVYIYFSTEEICACLNCARKKALKLMADLDEAGLTERKIRGQGKPTMIYVREFTPEDFQRGDGQECENHTARGVKRTPPEVPFRPSLQSEKRTHNDTDSNYTDLSQTHSNHSFPAPVPNGDRRSEGITESEMDEVRERIRENVDYETLLEHNPVYEDMIDEMVELMVETVCSKRDTIRVGREDLPRGMVTDRLMKLRQEHLQLALDGMRENTTKVRNIRQYLLTVLYNAPGTIGSYYSARVNYDLYQGGVP